MPAYEIYIHCACCDREHPLLVRVHLQYGPERKQSIAESFPEGSVPPQLSAMRGRNVLCLSLTSKTTTNFCSCLHRSFKPIRIAANHEHIDDH